MMMMIFLDPKVPITALRVQAIAVCVCSKIQMTFCPDNNRIQV